jgi:peptidoglycan/xylan/chitin deacetylase (PgdA/CDA1 family)
MKYFVLILLSLVNIALGNDFSLRDYRYQEPTHTEPMDDIGNWAVVNGSTVEETSLVQYYETDKKSIKLTNDGVTSSTFITKDIVTPIDITNHDIVLSYYIDPSDLAGISSITLFIGNNSLVYNVNRSFEDTGFPTAIGGWKEIKFSAASHKSITGTTGTDAEKLEVALSGFREMRFRINTVLASDTPSVIFDSIRFVPAAPKKTYLLTFDDGQEEDVLTASYMASKGVDATFYVSPNKIGTTGYMTLANLNSLKSQGHIIANHSWNHESLKDDNLSTEEAINAIVKASDWLRDNGFEDGANHWAVPGGVTQSFGWANDWKLLKPYCDTLRHTVPPYQPAGILDVKDLYPASFGNAPDDATDFISEFYTDNTSVIIFGFHSWNTLWVSGGEVTQAFKDVIDGIAVEVAAGDAVVRTMDQIIEEFEKEDLSIYGPRRSIYK